VILDGDPDNGLRYKNVSFIANKDIVGPLEREGGLINELRYEDVSFIADKDIVGPLKLRGVGI